MHFLFFDWDCYGKEDIIETMKKLGHKVTVKPLILSSPNKIDEEFVERTKLDIQKNAYDAVFTLNYFSSVSHTCNETNTKYLSWIYDSPFMRLYSFDIINPCNYIFIFDKHTYEDLKKKGANTVYYMPLAVNGTRLSRVSPSAKERAQFSCEVSFVGSMYNEKHNLYDRLIEKADAYTIGYLEGIIEAQLHIYGYNFLEEVLTEPIVERLMKAMPYAVDADSFGTVPFVYANYFLGRKLTSIERIRTLTAMSKQFQTFLYTPDETAQIGTTINKGPIHYYKTMPQVFQCSKINLNITLKSIYTGIPLRAMDILGAGGFLLSNYQSDFFDFFVPDQDLVLYGSQKELMDKVSYYLKNEKERKEIAANGQKNVLENHTYEIRLKEMFALANLK